MAFDGLVVRCIANELTGLLQGGRVDKIYMPDSEAVVIGVRSLGKNYKLYLSCNPSLPRMHLTNENRENPAVPPNFCMLLRKHLTGGHIVYIKQPDIERVIEIGIENRTEMGDTVVKRLIIEIMGRHSNIILVHQDGKIADCVRHVDASVSSLRLVLPGLMYESPPPQDKLSPFNVTRDIIEQTLFSCPDERKVDKFILEKFAGFSPAVAREIVYRGCGTVDIVYMSVTRAEVIAMAEIIEKLFCSVAENRFSPVIILGENRKPIDFSAIPLTQYNDLQRISSLSEYLDQFYINKEIRERMAARSGDMHKAVSNMLERYRRKSVLQRQSIDESEKMDELKLYADLITANIYRIKKGDKRISAANFYDENMQEVEIPLEGELTPAENAQRYYYKYNKLKNTAIAAKIQLKHSLQDIEYLESVQTAIENCDNLKELAEIKAELAAEGYIRLKAQKGKPKKEAAASQPSKFISSDGFTILVGKNNKQNDYLTLKLAKGHDIWFHTKNIPGSHTVIITDKKEAPAATIEQAAMLAAYHSKARASQNIAVDYTKISNVKKPSGAKPGMVIYVDYKTAYVTPDENKVKEMIM